MWCRLNIILACLLGPGCATLTGQGNAVALQDEIQAASPPETQPSGESGIEAGEPDDAPAGDPSARRDVPAWLNGSNWSPSSHYDVARSLLPRGFQQDQAEFAWVFQPSGRPKYVNWDEVERVLAESGLAGDNAAILIARRRLADPEATGDSSQDGRDVSLLDRVRRISLEGISPESEQDLISRISESAARQTDQRGSRKSDPDADLFELAAAVDRLRAAAIETWGRLQQRSDRGHPDWRLIASLADSDSPSAVRAAAVDALGWAVPPTQVRVVSEWLGGDRYDNQDDSFRRAVVSGSLRFAIGNPGDLSAVDIVRLQHLLNDTDARVRIGVGRLTALARHDRALHVLEQQTRDRDLAVRTAAYESLGLLATDDAIDRLKEAVQHSSPAVRAAAVCGLAIAAPERSVGVDDESSLVRAAAALALASRPTPANSHVAERLCRDWDRSVQQATVSAMSEWPRDLAVPVLVVAMETASLEPRRDALTQFRALTGIEQPLAIDGDREARRAELARWKREFNLPGRAIVTRTSRAVGQSDLARAFDRLDEDETDAAAWAVVESHLTQDFRSVEQALLQRQRDNRRSDWAELWDDVLAAYRADFRALSRLKSRNSSIRIQGAMELATFAKQATPSRLVTGQLPGVLKQEQNSAVWRGVIAAVSESPADTMEGVVLLALNSPWSDVRQLACEVIEQNPVASYASYLRPLLGDSDLAVRHAAIDAAGACGNPALIDGPDGGLRRLLSDPSRLTRMKASAAIARLGDRSGYQELLRLAHSADVQTRREAVATLNETNVHDVIDPVLSLAWTERDPQTQAEYLDLLASALPTGALWPTDADYERKLEYLATELRATL